VHDRAGFTALSAAGQGAGHQEMDVVKIIADQAYRRSARRCDLSVRMRPTVINEAARGHQMERTFDRNGATPSTPITIAEEASWKRRLTWQEGHSHPKKVYKDI